MKALAFTLGLLAVACTPSANNAKKNTPSTTPTTDRVYTISCESTGGEWVSYLTKRHPYNSYGARSGIWSFLTVEGQSVFATNCSAIFKAE